MNNTRPLIAIALLASLAACGGGGDGNGYLPIAAAPEPAAAPTPELTPEVVVPTTWKDADCTQTGSALPACSESFSDNAAHVTVAGGVIELSTDAAPLALTESKQNGVKGNKAVYSLPFLHKLKLSEYPGIAFDMKLNTPVDTTTINDVYVNTTVSLTCDGGNWLNLITTASDMLPVVGDDGYSRYSATPAGVQWYRTGIDPLLAITGSTLLHGALAAGAGGLPLSLAGLIEAYPEACIWNFPNPNADAADAVTPALAINLGDSGTTTAKKAWFKSIVIGDKTVF